MLAHSIEEYDQLRLLTELGHTVFSPGAYIDPRNPADDKRPALNIEPVAAMKKVVDRLGQPDHGAHGSCDGAAAHADPVDAVKRDTPDEMIEWADVLIVHHLEHTWLIPQWERLRGRLRVIWRTVGQSGDHNERLMAPLHAQGCEIIRYSPKERNIPDFAGEDTLIRFYKDPDEWSGWHGTDAVVTNVTQSLYQRSLADDGRLQAPGFQWTSYGFWRASTRDLPTRPIGPGSEIIGGLGALDWRDMRDQLQSCRAYLYTGTQPASYTLGLIEAMMTGIPVVSVGPEWFRILPYGERMFEGHEIAPLWAQNPEDAHGHLERMLREPAYASEIGAESRARALDLFGKDRIKAQWAEYLGAAVPARELVAA
jgi:hypothetical protein